LAEPAYLHQFVQVLVCSGNDPEITFNFSGFPDGTEAAFLKDSQELLLVTAVVHLLRPGIGSPYGPEMTDHVGIYRSCIRSFLMAEEDALHQVWGQGSTVDRQQNYYSLNALSYYGLPAQKAPCRCLFLR